MNEKCGKPVKCYDYMVRPCLRNFGHAENHCNPFSDTYPIEEDKKIIQKLQKTFNAKTRTVIQETFVNPLPVRVPSVREKKEKK